MHIYLIIKGVLVFVFMISCSNYMRRFIFQHRLMLYQNEVDEENIERKKRFLIWGYSILYKCHQ